MICGTTPTTPRPDRRTSRRLASSSSSFFILLVTFVCSTCVQFETMVVGFVPLSSSSRTFVVSNDRTSSSSWPSSFLLSSSSSSDNDEQQQQQSSQPDLFDYFDPLLSPHAYPNGVSPDNKLSSTITNDEIQNQQRQGRGSSSNKSVTPFGINYYSQSSSGAAVVEDDNPSVATKSESNTASAGSDDDTTDLFEYFDPLLSPHAYPNGISPDTVKPKELEVVAVDDSEISTASKQGSAKKPKKRVGILLMDHGSRNPASNARLQSLADLYQHHVDATSGTEDDDANNNGVSIIVEAAHMEIAAPSIPDGLQKLMDAHVEEIVCHPYFLSPGRHVQEDIPEIIDKAIEALQISIPVRTTSPVGSNTEMMLGLIHSSVTSTSQIISNVEQKQVCNDR